MAARTQSQHCGVPCLKSTSAGFGSHCSQAQVTRHECSCLRLASGGLPSYTPIAQHLNFLVSCPTLNSEETCWAPDSPCLNSTHPYSMEGHNACLCDESHLVYLAEETAFLFPAPLYPITGPTCPLQLQGFSGLLPWVVGPWAAQLEMVLP